MKKLMIAAALVGVAAFAQASTYNWKVQESYLLRGDEGATDDSVWAGNAIYVFDANAYSKTLFIESLKDGKDGFENALDNKIGTVKNSGAVSFGIAEDGSLTASAGKASVYAVLLDAKTLADAKNVYIIDYADATISASHESGSQVSFKHTSVTSTGAVGGDGWYTVAPEPTSGLLLLLGVAGLALKRKRA